MNNANRTNIICPFLGLIDDPDSLLAFPAERHNCYHSQPSVAIRLTHQGEFCLSEKHRDCSTFLNQQTASLQSPFHTPYRRRGNTFRKNLAITLGVLIIIFALGWGIMRQGAPSLAIEKTTQTIPVSAEPTGTNTPPPTMVLTSPTATNTPLPPMTVLTSHPTITPTRTNTPLPPMTVTPLPNLSKHQLDVPIGTERKFIIHRILSGETLDLYAEKYKTSVDAIIAINYYLRLTNRVGSEALTVIPIGFTDVSGLPVFVVYQVNERERGVDFEHLAQKFKVGLADFKNYNGITTVDERPQVGDLYLRPMFRRIP